MDNFFQRANLEAPSRPDLITESPPPVMESPSPPCFHERPLTFDRSPSLSPSISPNPSLSSRSPSVSPSLSFNSKVPPQSQQQPQKTHCFQEYVFRRPTPCQQCKQVITGIPYHAHQHINQQSYLKPYCSYFQRRLCNSVGGI